MSLFRELVEGSPDPLSLHRPDGTYVYVSPAFTDLLGHTAADLADTTLFDLVHPEDAPAAEARLRAALRRRERFCLSFRIRGTDGLHVWVEGRGALLAEDDRFLVAYRDLTARRSLLAALETSQQLADRYERLAAKQAAFLTSISHGARTPMTAVLGFATLLRDRWAEFPDDRLAFLLDRLVVTAQRLSGIVERATVLERLVGQPGEHVDVRPVRLEDLLDRLRRDVADPGGPIEVDVPRDAVVVANEEDLTRALRLLLDNAIVHTPTGTRIWVRATQAGGDTVLTVADDGPGVADELKDEIFEPFTSAGPKAEYDPGVGLGLSIVAEIVRRHRGCVWVTDREGGGAAFHLRLPTDGPVPGGPDAPEHR